MKININNKVLYNIFSPKKHLLQNYQCLSVECNNMIRLDFKECVLKLLLEQC